MDPQQSRWRPTRRQLLLAGGVATLAFLLIVICGYLFGWKWTGLPQRTLWDWLGLLVVPIVLAIGGYLFTRSENRATQAVAERRAQDDALQAYLDHMSTMLMSNKDQPSLYEELPPDSLKSLARARTLTVLPRLDGERKASVVQFLYESGLITKDRTVVDLKGADLSRADLSRADLSRADLRGADLSGAILGGAKLGEADLSEADLRGKSEYSRTDLSSTDLRKAKLRGAKLRFAKLRGADLRRRADLSEADLFRADLRETRLQGADLRGTNLENANLRGLNWREKTANLEWAKLSEANLIGADLLWAKLSGADLRGVIGKTNEELADETPDLKGATMPNGQTFEAWLREKESRKENAENA